MMRAEPRPRQPSRQRYIQEESGVRLRSRSEPELKYGIQSSVPMKIIHEKCRFISLALKEGNGLPCIPCKPLISKFPAQTVSWNSPTSLQYLPHELVHRAFYDRLYFRLITFSWHTVHCKLCSSWAQNQSSKLWLSGRINFNKTYVYKML